MSSERLFHPKRVASCNSFWTPPLPSPGGEAADEPLVLITALLHLESSHLEAATTLHLQHCWCTSHACERRLPLTTPSLQIKTPLQAFEVELRRRCEKNPALFFLPSARRAPTHSAERENNEKFKRRAPGAEGDDSISCLSHNFLCFKEAS